MRSRHKAREVALQILYQFDLATQSKLPAVQEDLTSRIRTHFEHFQVHESVRGYAAQLIVGTLHETEKLDEIIEKHASNWKVSRMSSIDRSLLRLASFELTQVKDVPAPVVIDEAIELAKDFGTSETPAFVNGILDSIHTSSPSKAPTSQDENNSESEPDSEKKPAS